MIPPLWTASVSMFLGALGMACIPDGPIEHAAVLVLLPSAWWSAVRLWRLP